MKRITLAAAIAIALMATLGLALPVAGGIGGHCPVTYTVQWGDTLSEIAAETGVSVADLARINGIKNVDLILAGRVLCIPVAKPSPTVPPPPPPSPVPEPRSSFDLVAEYSFDVTEQEDTGDEGAINWTLGRDGIAGTRLSYPLVSGDAIQTFAEPGEVRSASALGTPLLWVARSDISEPFTYTLVVIGDPQPLFDLQLEPSRSITDILPRLPTAAEIREALDMGDCPPDSREPVSALLDGTAISVTLRAELVAADRTFIPVSIEAIDYQASIETAQLCYKFPGFALHPNDRPQSRGYRLLMVLNNSRIGPPGVGWRARCSSWRHSGWWFRFLRAWYGCP